MSKKRRIHGAAVLIGYIYVCGGVTPSTQRDCEQYDPKKDRWETVEPMNKWRYYVFNMVAMNDHLYAFGGVYDEGSFERYDRDKNEWNLQKETYFAGLSQESALGAVIVLLHSHAIMPRFGAREVQHPDGSALIDWMIDIP